MLSEPRDRVSAVQDLAQPAHLLVWAMRAIALGREDCPIVGRTFRAACGARGDETLQAYGVFIKYVAMTARRPLRVHVPGCPCVGCDELALVDVIAAAQSSLQDADEQALKDRLALLMGRLADDALLFVAQSIASLLKTSGLIVRDYGSEPVQDPDEVKAVRLFN